MWDVSNVDRFEHMFRGASKFDVDISGWNVIKGTDYSRFLDGATLFNRNLCSWGPKILANPSGTGTPVLAMFLNTPACGSSADPNLLASPPGPFCAPC